MVSDDNDTSDGWRILYTAATKRISGLEAHVDAQARETQSWCKRALAAEKSLAKANSENERLLAIVMGSPAPTHAIEREEAE